MIKDSFFLDEKRNKFFLISLLILVVIYLAFNHYPPIMSLYEGPIVYKSFLPTQNPLLVLSISEDPSTTGPFNTFGYAFLIASRYIADIIGHSILNIRMPSIIFGLISLWLLYLIINRWYGWKIASITTFIVATNQYFITYQHFLLAQMVTLASVLFCIERFQNLLKKETTLSMITFALACALATLHYYMGRFVVISLLFFYLINFKEFFILSPKTYVKITNLNKIKNSFLIFLYIVIILIFFYPGNIFLLFTPEFIYPSFREEIFSHTGEFIYEKTNYTNIIWNNIIYYFKYYILDNTNSSVDLVVNEVPYRIEYLFLIALSLIGIIFSITKKFQYSNIFLAYMLAVTFFPMLLSTNVNPEDLRIYFEQTGREANFEESSSILTPVRVLFSIPFICFMSVLGANCIYQYIEKKNINIKPLMFFALIVFIFFRIFGYFNEIHKFENKLNSYEFDFSKPAKSDGLQLPKFPDFKEKKEKHYNQIYFFKLSEFISNEIKKKTTENKSIQLLYVPEEIYTPYFYYHGDMAPNKGSKYYFPMYLTFYLQDRGINVSYLVKNEDIKDHFLKKAINIVDRYRKNQAIYSVEPDLKKLPLEEQQALDDHLYPKNKEQERVLKLFSIIFDMFDNFDLTKNWLDSIRNAKGFTSNSVIGNYHINTTSRKKPDYLIITNEQEFEEMKKKTDYKILLQSKL
jgi:hypothetical protein